jgi:hypothetical protein
MRVPAVRVLPPAAAGIRVSCMPPRAGRCLEEALAPGKVDRRPLVSDATGPAARQALAGDCRWQAAGRLAPETESSVPRFPCQPSRPLLASLVVIRLEVEVMAWP